MHLSDYFIVEKKWKILIFLDFYEPILTSIADLGSLKSLTLYQLLGIMMNNNECKSIVVSLRY